MIDSIPPHPSPDELRRASIKDYHEGAFGHFPNRTFAETKNVRKLREIIEQSTRTNALEIDSPTNIKAREQLENAILYDCFGRIFPTPNSAADFIPVIDPKSIDTAKHPELEGVNFDNCIALIKVGGKLAVVGGFNDVGESLAKTAGRESNEELHIEDIGNAVMIGKASKSIRDKRFTVDTTITSGTVNYEQLKSGDDAEKDTVIIVKLINDDGSLNTSFFEAGKEYTDIRGKAFTHDGWRADHKFLVERLYRYWKQYGRSENLTLTQTLEKMSAVYPQEWFKGYAKHEEGADIYPPHVIEGVGSILETPNIKFALKVVAQIFEEAGFADASIRAERFVYECNQKDILPLFPQASVAVDCLVVDGDELIVEKITDAHGEVSYALPGSFFSPDPKDPDKPMDKVISMQEFAESMVWDRIGMDVRVDGYLVTAGGTDATGELVDKRYPRLTNVVMARASNTYNAEAKRKGHEIARLRIRKEDGGFNDELFKLKWQYGHDTEILPQFMRFLKLFDPDNKKRAEDIVRENAFGDSFGP